MIMEEQVSNVLYAHTNEHILSQKTSTSNFYSITLILGPKYSTSLRKSTVFKKFEEIHSFGEVVTDMWWKNFEGFRKICSRKIHSGFSVPTCQLVTTMTPLALQEIQAYFEGHLRGPAIRKNFLQRRPRWLCKKSKSILRATSGASYQKKFSPTTSPLALQEIQVYFGGHLRGPAIKKNFLKFANFVDLFCRWKSRMETWKYRTAHRPAVFLKWNS